MKSKNIINNVKDSLKRVFKKPQYTLIAGISAFLLIATTTLAINFKLVLSNPELTIPLLGGIITNNTTHSLTTLIVVGILFGINVAVVIFKMRSKQKTSKKHHALATAGTTAGILSAGCASCGVGILALLGLAGGAASLPLGGYELWIPAVLLLLLSIIWTANSMASCDSCQVAFSNR